MTPRAAPTDPQQCATYSRGRGAAARSRSTDAPAGAAWDREVPAVGFKPERRATVMARHDIDPAPFTLLWMGVVDVEENLGFLFELIAKVRARSAALQLVIVGDGPALEHYRMLTHDMECVYWLGSLSRVDQRDWCSAADLLVLPSTGDDSGMVALQAQAAGLPAIVTDIGEPRRIVRNGDTGYTLSLADPKAWALHVLTLMHSKFSNPAAWAGKRHDIVRALEHRSDLSRELAEALNLEAPAGTPPRRGAAGRCEAA